MNTQAARNLQATKAFKTQTKTQIKNSKELNGHYIILSPVTITSRLFFTHLLTPNSLHLAYSTKIRLRGTGGNIADCCCKMLTRAGSRAGRLLQQVHLPSTTSASASPFYFLRHCIRAISSSPVLAHTQGNFCFAVASRVRTLTFHNTEKECWSCGSCINEWKVFCGSCDSIQPPQDADYFGVFEMWVPSLLDLCPTHWQRNF